MKNVNVSLKVKSNFSDTEDLLSEIYQVWNLYPDEDWSFLKWAITSD